MSVARVSLDRTAGQENLKLQRQSDRFWHLQARRELLSDEAWTAVEPRESATACLHATTATARRRQSALHWLRPSEVAVTAPALEGMHRSGMGCIRKKHVSVLPIAPLPPVSSSKAGANSRRAIATGASALGEPACCAPRRRPSSCCSWDSFRRTRSETSHCVNLRAGGSG